MSQTLLFDLVPQRRVWKVSEITQQIGNLLEGAFQDVWIEGEVSNFRPAQSGHLYFTLKDSRSQIRCVCFRDEARLLKFRPDDGLHVTLRGALGVYEPRGEYQIYVSHIEPVGLGALQLAFEQLKKQLQAEGLFDQARKKPLPVLPLCIGVISSPAGAAIRDILRVLKRRFANLHVQLYPVRVQGDGAAGDIVAALRHFNRVKFAEVLILARGGGSLEDLWAFNEEIVARAIFESVIPVITGVGHETDFTIADFVADLRAPTPSAAAEIVVRSRQEFERHIAEYQSPVDPSHSLPAFRAPPSGARSRIASRLSPARIVAAASSPADRRAFQCNGHGLAPAAFGIASAAHESERAAFFFRSALARQRAAPPHRPSAIAATCRAAARGGAKEAPLQRSPSALRRSRFARACRQVARRV